MIAKVPFEETPTHEVLVPKAGKSAPEDAQREECHLLYGWMSRNELAAVLGLTSDTLARWQTNQVGPPCIRLGRKVLYRRAAVQEWLTEQEARAVRGRTH